MMPSLQYEKPEAREIGMLSSTQRFVELLISLVQTHGGSTLTGQLLFFTFNLIHVDPMNNVIMWLMCCVDIQALYPPP